MTWDKNIFSDIFVEVNFYKDLKQPLEFQFKNNNKKIAQKTTTKNQTTKNQEPKKLYVKKTSFHLFQLKMN